MTGAVDLQAEKEEYHEQLFVRVFIGSLENKLEAVVRVGGISTLANGQEGTWEYGAGLNYYIEGNNVKLQTDMIKVSEAPISNPYTGLANVNDDVLMFRVQLTFAF